MNDSAIRRALQIKLVCICHLMLFPSMGLSQAPRSVLLDVPGGRFVGLPIHWSQRDVALLESNGRIRVFETSDVANHNILDDPFQPQTLLQASRNLQAELGKGFETLVTGPYVIGAPVGETKRWEARFRTLLAGYLRFFEVRGWPLRSPDFPLIIIVLPTREEFVRMSRKETDGERIENNLAGMYIPRTNRCLLYHFAHSGTSTNWEATEATLVHEAIHQLAYNTGAHERLFEHPLWFVEGLATMFEIPSVYDSSIQVSSIETRIHPEKREKLKQLNLDGARLGAYMQSIVTSDELFRTQPETAYALGWALTFYIVERMPRQYSEFVGLQRARGFQVYTAGDRELDFRNAFGTPSDQLAPHILSLLGLR